MGSTIAVAVVLALLLGGAIWLFVEGRKTGQAKSERDQLKGSQERQDEASEVLAEPAPTGWREILARRAARRKRRLRNGGAGKTDTLPGPD